MGDKRKSAVEKNRTTRGHGGIVARATVYGAIAAPATAALAVAAKVRAVTVALAIVAPAIAARAAPDCGETGA